MVSTLKPWDPHMWKPLIALSFIAALAAQSVQPAPVPSLPGTIDGLPSGGGVVGLVLFLLGSMFTTLINLYIAQRNKRWEVDERERVRRWDAEDRERLATQQREETRRAAEALRLTTETKSNEQAVLAQLVAQRIIDHQSQQHAALAEKVDANTQVNEQALHAANTVNDKIKTYGALVVGARYGGKRKGDILAEPPSEDVDDVHEVTP